MNDHGDVSDKTRKNFQNAQGPRDGMATKGEDPLESRMCTAPSLDLKENKLSLAQPRTNKLVLGPGDFTGGCLTFTVVGDGTMRSHLNGLSKGLNRPSPFLQTYAH